jgi:hypothetical protein
VLKGSLNEILCGTTGRRQGQNDAGDFEPLTCLGAPAQRGDGGRVPVGISSELRCASRAVGTCTHQIIVSSVSKNVHRQA